MDHLSELQRLLEASAEHIDEYGHHQFDMWEGKACCIMGAPRMVDNESSHSHILRDVLAHLGYDEKWNDKPGRTKEEVVEALRSSIPLMTADLMRDVYGTKWQAILDFIGNVDNWAAVEYAEIERESSGEEYPPEYAAGNKQYLNGLAGFITTVMTSGKAKTSVPFKRYFDTNYEKNWK